MNKLLSVLAVRSTGLVPEKGLLESCERCSLKNVMELVDDLRYAYIGDNGRGPTVSDSWHRYLFVRLSRILREKNDVDDVSPVFV